MRLAGAVVAPADGGAVGPHAAGVDGPGGYRGEGARGGLCLAVVVAPQQASVPSVLIAQVWKRPALDRGEGAGRRGGPAEGVSPQQASVPFVLIAQVWSLPALTAVKVPAGGVDLPVVVVCPSRPACRRFSPRSCASRRRSAT